MQSVGAGLGVVIAGIAAFVIFTTASGNFHAVIPGEVYRSAQPLGAALARYRNEYGIRTVLNLRGSNEREA